MSNYVNSLFLKNVILRHSRVYDEFIVNMCVVCCPKAAIVYDDREKKP